MTNKILHRILFFLLVSFTSAACAQEVPSKNWDVEKIKGVRSLPYPPYTGFPFFTDTWVPGKIELEDGVIIDSLYFRYSSYKDELIYYNEKITAQIVIDKMSLKGFLFTGTDGNIHVFRKFYYDNFGKGNRYFEVLADGETDLLAYRKVDLDTSPVYKDEKGRLLNMTYDINYSYYFYSPEKGYTTVRMNQASLITKFDKLSQKPIKKLLRKHKIKIYSEESFTQAWKMIEKEGYKVVF
jgi:hypothetical protein